MIVRPERVYKHVPVSGPEAVSFETTVTLADEDGQTRLTMRGEFPSVKAREFVVTKYGSIEAMNQYLRRLEEILESLTKEG